jgi:hypothetical protein
MELSLSWEAKSRSVAKKIPNFLWNSKVQYCVHKGPPLVSVLGHMIQVHTTPILFP